MFDGSKITSPDAVEIVRAESEEKDEPERLRRVCEREGCDIFEAKNDENIRLEAIHERYKKLYNIDDFEDSKNYDLVIDTANISPEEIVDIILAKIKEKNV